jgi:hypothetical protein
VKNRAPHKPASCVQRKPPSFRAGLATQAVFSQPQSASSRANLSGGDATSPSASPSREAAADGSPGRKSGVSGKKENNTARRRPLPESAAPRQHKYSACLLGPKKGGKRDRRAPASTWGLAQPFPHKRVMVAPPLSRSLRQGGRLTGPSATVDPKRGSSPGGASCLTSPA